MQCAAAAANARGIFRVVRSSPQRLRKAPRRRGGGHPQRGPRAQASGGCLRHRPPHASRATSRRWLRYHTESSRSGTGSGRPVVQAAAGASCPWPDREAPSRRGTSSTLAGEGAGRRLARSQARPWQGHRRHHPRVLRALGCPTGGGRPRRLHPREARQGVAVAPGRFREGVSAGCDRHRPCDLDSIRLRPVTSCVGRR